MTDTFCAWLLPYVQHIQRGWHLNIDNTIGVSIHRYVNLKRKLYNCNASVYFNKQCLKRSLTPSYANIKVPNTSPAYRYTQQKIPNTRIKDEVRYLYSKKQQLNQQIYRLHLYLSYVWDHTWPHIQETLEEKLQRETQTKYKSLDKKLENLSQAQTQTPQKKHTFYPRVVNNTDISFSNMEMSLLQKGPSTTYTPKIETGYRTWRLKQRRPSHSYPLMKERPTGKQWWTAYSNYSKMTARTPHPESRLTLHQIQTMEK